MNPDSATRLVSVAVISRHGQRTSVGMKAIEEGLFDDVNGQLTDNGRQQLQLLGQMVKTRYSVLFEKQMPEITVKSSGIKRCVDSATSVVSGITDASVSVTIDNRLLLFPNTTCPSNVALMMQVVESEEIGNLVERFSDIQEVAEKSLRKEVNSLDLMLFSDAITTNDGNGEEVPKGITDHLVQRMNEFEATFMHAMVANRQLVQTWIGPFYSDLFNAFQNTEQSRLLIYGTHDVMIDGISRTLDATPPCTRPPYAASFIFELHQNVSTGQKFVAAFYWTPGDQFPGSPVAPAGCVKGELCNWEDFWKDLPSLKPLESIVNEKLTVKVH